LAKTLFTIVMDRLCAIDLHGISNSQYVERDKNCGENGINETLANQRTRRIDPSRDSEKMELAQTKIGCRE